MKKLPLLFFGLLIILASFSSASVLYKMDFENWTGYNENGWVGSANGNLKLLTSAVDCYGGSKCGFIESGAADNYPQLSYGSMLGANYLITTTFMLKANATNLNKYLLNIRCGTTKSVIYGVAANGSLYDRGGGSQYMAYVADNAWHKITTNCINESGNATVYIDDVFQRNFTSYAYTPPADVNVWEITYFHIDNWAVCNITDDCYNLAYGIVGNLTLGILAPLNNTYNTTQQLNLSYKPILNYTPSYCALFTNYTGVWMQNKTNTSPIVNNSVNVLNWDTKKDGQWLWNIQCNTTYNDNASNQYNFTIKIDTVMPTLSVANPGNNSVINNTLNITINCTDETAYLLNFTIYNSSTIILSKENTTTSGTFLSLNNITNILNYAPGKYFLNVSCSDGHTSAFFTDADNIKANYNSLEYTFDKDVIKVEALSDDLQEITTEKAKDRYTFNLEFTKSVSSFQYKITASKIVQYDSKYPGHLILDDTYWFDTAPYTAHIDSIKDGVALITVDVPNEDNLKTESLGGLNTVSYIYNLTFRYYLPPTQTTTAISGQVTNITIDFLNVSGMALNSTLFYNGVSYPLTSFNNTIGSSYTRVLFSFIPTSASTANASYYFNYSYSAGGAVSYYGNTTNYTGFIFNAALIACNPGDTNATTLNLSFYDESSLAPLNVSGQAIIESWIDNPATKINNTFNWSFKQFYTICIYPNTASMHINAYIKYNSSYTHRYYINSGNLSNTSQSLNLYNFESSTGVSLLNGVARDYTSYNFLENIYAKLLRYYPSENLWRIVQMDKSDTYGQVVFHVIEQSQDYKMVFEYNSAQIGETSEMKFVCTAGICSLTFPLSLTSTASDTFTSSLSFDNITGIFTLVFNEATGESHNVWLQVSHKIGTVDNLVCNNSLNAASGSILCNIANITGMFTAIGYKQTLTTPIDYLDIDRPAGKLWQFASAYRNDLVLLAGGVLVTATMAGAMMGAGLGLIGAGVGIIAIFAIGFINLPVGIFVAILLILLLILFKVEI